MTTNKLNKKNHDKKKQSKEKKISLVISQLNMKEQNWIKKTKNLIRVNLS
jgi:hypothetical protein